MEFGGDCDGGDDDDGDSTSWWMRSDYGGDCKFVVSSIILSLKGMGAFTFYTWFDEPISTPPGTVGRYGRSVIPLVVKFSAT